MCDNGTAFTQVTVWDKTYQGSNNGTYYYNWLIQNTSSYQDYKAIGTNSSFFTVVSVDETNGIFKVKAVSNTYIPLKNIVWYAE